MMVKEITTRLTSLYSVFFCLMKMNSATQTSALCLMKMYFFGLLVKMFTRPFT
jgi:hypothetical protein